MRSSQPTRRTHRSKAAPSSHALAQGCPPGPERSALAYLGAEGRLPGPVAWPKVADPTAFAPHRLRPTPSGDEPDQATKDLGPLFRKILELPSTRSLWKAAALRQPLAGGTARHPCASWGLARLAAGCTPTRWRGGRVGQ